MKPQLSSVESIAEPIVSTRRPRIGVVGLGAIAQKAYLPILSQAERWELVGAYSPDQQKRNEFASTTGWRVSLRWMS